MSQGTTPLTHPKAPHNQPFQGAGRKNLAKKNSWWSVTSSTYWRNAKKPKKDRAEKSE